MKTNPILRRAKGFTLIELLVVITIIAVLAAMSFAGVNLALRKAKKTQGLVLATGLSRAIEDFYGEYNRLPEGFSGEIQTDSASELLQILTGQEPSGNDMQNPRSLTFFSAPEAKGKKNGLDYGGGDTVQGLFDPFGNPFTVVLNTDYEDVLQFSFDGKQVKLRGVQAAVYSTGGDKEAGTTDDVKSW